MNKIITTGHVKRILLNGAVKYGGAVAKRRKRRLAARSKSISLGRMIMMKTIF